MPITQTLRGFRDYNEKDVINLYAISGAPIDTTYQILASKGTIVKIVGDGFRNDVEPDQMIGGFGQFQVNNFQAQRYGNTAQVAIASSLNGDANPIGMTLFDTRELDENLELLKYRPSKAAEMEAVLSGQAVPIVTKGLFLYSGIQIGTGSPVIPGNPAYLGASGGVCTTGSVQVGRFFGNTGVDTAFAQNSQMALIRFNFV
jgi:hypothetical protein